MYLNNNFHALRTIATLIPGFLLIVFLAGEFELFRHWINSNIDIMFIFYLFVLSPIIAIILLTAEALNHRFKKLNDESYTRKTMPAYPVFLLYGAIGVDLYYLSGVSL